jgi:hypothetical protein
VNKFNIFAEPDRAAADGCIIMPSTSEKKYKGQIAISAQQNSIGTPMA